LPCLKKKPRTGATGKLCPIGRQKPQNTHYANEKKQRKEKKKQKQTIYRPEKPLQTNLPDPKGIPANPGIPIAKPITAS